MKCHHLSSSELDWITNWEPFKSHSTWSTAWSNINSSLIFLSMFLLSHFFSLSSSSLYSKLDVEAYLIFVEKQMARNQVFFGLDFEFVEKCAVSMYEEFVSEDGCTLKRCRDTFLTHDKELSILNFHFWFIPSYYLCTSYIMTRWHFYVEEEI